MQAKTQQFAEKESNMSQSQKQQLAQLRRQVSKLESDNQKLDDLCQRQEKEIQKQLVEASSIQKEVVKNSQKSGESEVFKKQMIQYKAVRKNTI